MEDRSETRTDDDKITNTEYLNRNGEHMECTPPPSDYGNSSGDEASKHKYGLENYTEMDPLQQDSKSEKDKPDNEDQVNNNSCHMSHMDRGWAWMVVVGCALMHLTVGGVGRSYGVIYIYLQERFDSSAAITAWVGGASSAVRMGASPLATALSNRFTARSVVFTGGIIIGLGCLLSSFAPATEYMFFSFSVLVGFGGALVYAPGIVMVGQYFDKYRAVAMGLATAGSGVGVFTFPPLIQWLFTQYGFLGGMLIVSAITLNNCVSGMLYRPQRTTHKKDSNPKRIGNKSYNAPNTPSEETSSNKHGKFLRTLEEGLTNSSKNLAAENSPMLKKANPHQPKITAVNPDTQNKETNSRCCNTDNLYKYLDWRLLKQPTFILYVISLGFVTLSYLSGQMLVPTYARERGLNQGQAVWLLSVIGITDTIGRASSGAFFNLPIIKPQRRHYYMLSIVISGLTHILWAYSHNYVMFIAVSSVHGLFTGVVISQRAVICIDLMGMEKFSSAFGLTVFVQGIGILIGPAIAGLIRDIVKSYFYSFIFTGLTAFISAICLTCEWTFIARKKTITDIISIDVGVDDSQKSETEA